MNGATVIYMSSGDHENQTDWSHVGVTRSFRVEHRTEGGETVILARVKNVFPHHDTLTQYVSRLLNEGGAERLYGELVLVDDESNAVLARRDLGRASSETRRGRQKPRRSNCE
jgi:hypothetical protein